MPSEDVAVLALESHRGNPLCLLVHLRNPLALLVHSQNPLALLVHLQNPLGMFVRLRNPPFLQRFPHQDAFPIGLSRILNRDEYASPIYR